VRIDYDREVDALYIVLQEKPASSTREFAEALSVDLDEGGRLIGLEVLDATKRYEASDLFDISTRNLILQPAEPR
jgi:uncharacterized protein YuzE